MRCAVVNIIIKCVILCAEMCFIYNTTTNNDTILLHSVCFTRNKKLIIIVESLLRTFYVALFCFKNAHTHDASPWLVETNINIHFCVHILLWYNNNIILIFWSSSIPHFVINPWMDGLPRRRYLVQFCFYITPFFTSLQPTTPLNVTTHQ